MKKIAIILAAGEGERLQKDTPKCLFKLDGKELYKYTLEKFVFSDLFDLIILVLPDVLKFDHNYVFPSLVVINGGKTRNESFELAMQCIENVVSPNDKIVVHDAARIFVDQNDITKICNCKEDYATLCYKSSDTIFAGSNPALIEKPVYNIQTPQMFRHKVYLNAKKNNDGTDLFSYLNLKPNSKNLIISSNGMFNLKITYPQDLEVARKLLLKK